MPGRAGNAFEFGDMVEKLQLVRVYVDGFEFAISSATKLLAEVIGWVWQNWQRSDCA
jgi:hypothetical protein